MKKYKVYINGKNFLLEMDGKVESFGFYTTRFLEANDEGEAESLAIELLRKDPKLSLVKNERDDPPMMYVEEITEIDSFDEIKLPGGGYTFYPEEDEDEEAE